MFEDTLLRRKKYKKKPSKHLVNLNRTTLDYEVFALLLCHNCFIGNLPLTLTLNIQSSVLKFNWLFTQDSWQHPCTQTGKRSLIKDCPYHSSNKKNVLWKYRTRPGMLKLTRNQVPLTDSKNQVKEPIRRVQHGLAVRSYWQWRKNVKGMEDAHFPGLRWSELMAETDGVLIPFEPPKHSMNKWMVSWNKRGK